LATTPTCSRGRAETSPSRSAPTASSWWTGSSRRSPTRSRRRSRRFHRCRSNTWSTRIFTAITLAAGTISGLTGAKAVPRPAEALPKETYTGGSFALEVGGRKAQLTYIANAHTDGDTWIYFADANVLCTGDTVNNLKRYQNIDYANGGDVRGMIRASDTYLKASNDQTKVVVGHGPLASRKDIAEFREMLITSRDRIEKLFNEGKSEAEVLALNPLADLNEKWAANNPALAQAHTKNVYNSFKRF
jgi:glyoxylase-like metal-dependent hydrolase (beta-lactamase superfamily II)